MLPGHLDARIISSCPFGSRCSSPALWINCFRRSAWRWPQVLERIGCSVDFPEAQTCCGQPAFNSGYRNEATAGGAAFPERVSGCRIHRRTLRLLHVDGRASLRGSVRKGTGLAGESAAAGAARVGVFAVSDRGHESEDVGARLDKIVTYHDSCHALRELHIKQGPRELLSHVRGLELREMDIPEECCGFGGTFSVKFDEISGGMARTKIDAIQRTGAEAVVSIDSSCLMQLQGVMSRDGVPVRAMHLAEVLASR